MLENVRKQMSPAEANKIGVGFGDWAGCLRETGDCSRTWPGVALIAWPQQPRGRL
jgi:hypothetical protein